MNEYTVSIITQYIETVKVKSLSVEDAVEEAKSKSTGDNKKLHKVEYEVRT